MVYRSVDRAEIIQSLMHLRNLFRAERPRDERETRAFELRELVTKDLLSNLPRNQQHPRLKTVLGLSELYSLTLDGAHRLFGYELDALREYDLALNGTRTHIECSH